MRPGGNRLAGLGLGASQLELEYGGGLGGATSWVDTYGYDDSLTGYEPVFASREAPLEYDKNYKQEQMAKRTGDWQGDVMTYERKRKRQRIASKSS